MQYLGLQVPDLGWFPDPVLRTKVEGFLPELRRRQVVSRTTSPHMFAVTNETGFVCKQHRAGRAT